MRKAHFPLDGRPVTRGLAAISSLLALGATALAQQTTGTPGSPGATTTIDGKYLPPPPPKFGGVINLEASKSNPIGRRKSCLLKARPTFS
jgi:hypothetical protein